MISQPFDIAKRPSFETAAEVRREEVRYFIGVDLGQAHDPTAIAVVRRLRFLVSHDVQLSTPTWKEGEPTIYQCGYLESLQSHHPGMVAIASPAHSRVRRRSVFRLKLRHSKFAPPMSPLGQNQT